MNKGKDILDDYENENEEINEDACHGNCNPICNECLFIEEKEEMRLNNKAINCMANIRIQKDYNYIILGKNLDSTKILNFIKKIKKKVNINENG